MFNYYRNNADLLVLQETHSEAAIEQVWEAEWGGRMLFSHGTSASRGIAVCMDKNIFAKVVNVYKDLEGRLIVFDIKENETVVMIAGHICTK